MRTTMRDSEIRVFVFIKNPTTATVW